MSGLLPSTAMLRHLQRLRLLIVAAGFSATGFAGGYGFDISTPPALHAEHLATARLDGRAGTWMRVRGLVDHHRIVESAKRTVETDRAGLLALRKRGVRTAVFLRWNPNSWASGSRPGRGHRLPIDLQEAFERAKWLGGTYGDLVDAWEVDNEPDIDFVPENAETYAAFLKAVYLGLHTGIAQKISGLPLERRSNWIDRKHSLVSPARHMPANRVPSPPRVIMAPLALPPGPYLERLWENGVASYTDGFNFHYYGYPEDFTGVYRQFENAVRTLPSPTSPSAAQSAPKTLPVFITEYGYGLLDAEARHTVEGRVRQWRWFRDVVRQVHELRPEAPMAFYWRPYYEANLNEFGLLMDQPVSRPAADDAAATAQGFSPADFGASQAEPWMRRIGAKIGDWHASPALAYLWDFARQNPYRPEHWSTAATPASPVVIDLLPVSNMTQAKSSGGYLLENVSPTRPHASAWSGIACVLLYNFSRETVSGRVEIEGLPPSLTNSVAHITLAPGERHEMPLELSVSPTEWRRQTLRVRFIPTDEGVAPSVFSTALYPSLAALPATRIADFTGHASESRQTALATRPLASGEPGLHPHGRWLASEGVRVEESADGVWRFHIDYLPAEPLRPAMVELALPDDFAFPSASFLRLQRRKVAPAEASDVFTAPLPAPTPDQAKPRAGKAGDMMDVYFRTENGNLFQTWPRLRVTPEWTQYLESADNFTMAFFGRAAPPWRFSENKPASLVFFLRPSALPATFEVQRAEIVRYGFE